MIAAREWITQSGPPAPLTEPELVGILAELFATNPAIKPPVAISITPRPEATGYFVLVDEDLHITAIMGLEPAVAMGWVVEAE
jgi:hypothetical protein